MNRRWQKLVKALALAVLGFIAQPGAANGLSHEDLHALASSFIAEELETIEAMDFRTTTKIGKISPHLHLDMCETEVERSLKRDILTAANNSLEMRCASPAWRIYIPVEIEVFGKVVAASTSIPKNTRIQAHHLMPIEQQINTIRYGHYDSTAQVAGMIAKRSIKKGSTIRPSQLRAPQVIMRGDQVLILAQTDQITIQMKGKALSAGYLGEQISVKNLSSERVIRAQVIEKGKVSVLM